MGRFSVIYDACVLYPAGLRDTLMRLALTDLFKARWTDQIHDEWIGNLAEKNQFSLEHLHKVRDMIDANVRYAKVTNYDYLIDCLDLPDPDDRHVLAAAIHSKSDAIVTFNLKDFPVEYLARYDVDVIHPDDFIVYQFDINESLVLRSFKAQRAALKNPTLTVEEFIANMYRRELPQTAAKLEEFHDLI